MTIKHTVLTGPGAAALALALAACATEPANAQDRAMRTDRITPADDGPAPNLVVFEFDTHTTANGQGDKSSGQGGQAGQSRATRSGGNQARSGEQGGGPDPISIVGVLAAADAPELARLVLTDPSDGPARAKGTLLFDDVTALAAWRRTRMEDFLEPMGGADAVTTTIRIVNKDVLDTYGLGRTQTGLENLSVTYTNAGNDTGGADADIDAVTVVCPGDFAECSPSN